LYRRLNNIESGQESETNAETHQEASQPTSEKKLRGKKLSSIKGKNKAARRNRVRPNEEPETIAEYKAARPNHTAKEWIEEALYVSGQHCEDHDLEVSTFLYCALDALNLVGCFREPINQVVAAGIITKQEAQVFDTVLSHYHKDKAGRLATLEILAKVANGRRKKRGGAR
jgi:hypothetical protein